MGNNPNSPRALVTGASSGLGAAFRSLLQAQGWQVTGVDRKSDSDSDHLKCDLSVRKDVDGLIRSLIELGNQFDLVILNAGNNATGRFEKLPLDSQLRLVALNAETPMVMASALAGNGLIRAGGNLLFVASLSVFTGYPGAATYAASKNALAVYAKSIRKPFGRKGIAVSCAYPGPLRTEHAARFAPQGAVASKRMPPEDAARLILGQAFSGKSIIIPGGAPRMFALASRLFPQATAFAMRQVIFRKLDRETW